MTKLIQHITILLSLSTAWIPSYGQTYFINSYDLNNNQPDVVFAVDELGQKIFLSNGGRCNYFADRCFRSSAITLDGKHLETKEYDFIDIGQDPIFQDDYYLIGGDNTPMSSHYSLLKSFIDKDSIVFRTYKIDTNYHNYVFIGMIGYNDNIVLFGQINDSLDTHNDMPKVKGLMMWVDKSTMELDTFTIIEGPAHWTILYEAKVDRQGHLVMMYEYFKEVAPNFFANEKAIARINESKSIEWSYIGPAFSGNNGSSPIDITKENNYVFAYRTGFSDFTGVEMINSFGEHAWGINIDSMYDHFNVFFIDDLTVADNGDILGCGNRRNGFLGFNQVGMIFRLTPFGQLKWIRFYELDRGLNPRRGPEESSRSFLNDVIELSNGDIVAGGEVGNYYNDPVFGPREDQDLLVIKVDSMGCLWPDCDEIMSVKLYAHSLIEQNIEWIEAGPDRYRIGSDTLHRYNKVYYSVQQSNDGQFWQPTKYHLAEYTHNVLIYDETTNQESLLYRFGARVGDTLTIGAIDYTVTDIDSTELFNGERRKQLHLMCGDKEVTWIESVGDSRGLLAPLTYACDTFFRLQCQLVNDQVHYTTDPNDGCIITTTTDQQQDPSIKVYPNPSDGRIHIDVISSLRSSGLVVECYSILGQILKAEPLKRPHHTIDLDTYSGWVFLRILDREKVILKTKVFVLGY